jgi:hypothetical protein
MRVELRDGQWAELRERITHGADKRIRRAEDSVGRQTQLLREFITAWKMNDPDGKAIELSDEDAIDRMPEDLADELVGDASKNYGRATVPNAPTPPSSGSGSSGAA